MSRDSGAMRREEKWHKREENGLQFCLQKLQVGERINRKFKSIFIFLVPYLYTRLMCYVYNILLKYSWHQFTCIEPFKGRWQQHKVPEQVLCLETVSTFVYMGSGRFDRLHFCYILRKNFVNIFSTLSKFNK